MRVYETMLLLDSSKQDAEIEQAIDRFTAFVTERGGSVQKTEKWGRRRLAYEIGDQAEGYYAVLTYELPPDQRGDLHAALSFLDGLVRSKTVVPEARVRKVAT